MQRGEASADPVNRAFGRLAAAIEALERAVEKRLRQAESFADADVEFTLMQDDRARLAVELDAALERGRALEAANAEASRRLAEASRAIGAVLAHAEPDEA